MSFQYEGDLIKDLDLPAKGWKRHGQLIEKQKSPDGGFGSVAACGEVFSKNGIHVEIWFTGSETVDRYVVNGMSYDASSRTELDRVIQQAK